MSASQDLLEEEFTEVASPRRGRLQSALFYHLKHSECRCFSPLVADRKIQMVIQPTAARQAFILKLNPSILIHDIFALLPLELQSRYTLGGSDVHIRIDREFYGNDGATKDQLRQWHLTYRVAVANHEYIAMHVFYNYNRCLGVWIKEPNKSAYLADELLCDKAKTNADEAYQIVKLAIDDMKLQMNTLNAEFQLKLKQLYKISYLRKLKDAELDETIKEISALNEHLAGYYEDVIDRRLGFALSFVEQWRYNKLPALLPTSPVTPPLTSSVTPYVTPSPPAVTTSPKADFSKHDGQSKARLRTRSRTKSGSPTDEIEIKNIEELREVLKKLRVAAETPFATAKEALDFDARVQKIKIELSIAFVTATDEKTERTCNAIEAVIATLPTLLDEFCKFASDLNAEAVKELFALVQADIPEDFYMRFLFTATQYEMTPHDQTNAMAICELFFAHSQGYRMFVSCLDGVTMGFKAFNGREIRTSMLLHVAMKQYFALFKLLLKQSGAIDFQGYIQDDHVASLLTVLCALSRDANCNAFIDELLARKPLLQEPYPFAQGTKIATVSEEAILTASLKNMQLTPEANAAQEAHMANDFVKRFTYAIGEVPYLGSALSAYCSAKYISNDILIKLAEPSSTLHLILGFAHFCFDGICSVIVFSNSKFGIQIEIDPVKREQIAKRQSKLCIPEGVKYLGSILGQPYNPELHMVLDTFVNLVKSRLAVASPEELIGLIGQLQTTLAIYQADRHSRSALACTRAIVFLTMYIEPSVETHRLILEMLITAGDLHDQDLEHKIVDGHDRVTERNIHYQLAQKFVLVSKYRSALASHADLPRITAVVDYCDRLKSGGASSATFKLR